MVRDIQNTDKGGARKAMDAEVTLFSKPEELIAWADTFDILLNPSIEDAAISA